jgi:hypothetical protein
MPSLIVFRSLVKYDHLSLHLPLVVQPTARHEKSFFARGESFDGWESEKCLAKARWYRGLESLRHHLSDSRDCMWPRCSHRWASEQLQPCLQSVDKRRTSGLHLWHWEWWECFRVWCHFSWHPRKCTDATRMLADSCLPWGRTRVAHLERSWKVKTCS